MHKALFAALRQDHTALVRDLPDVAAWADQFFGKKTVLDPDKPFLDQVCALANSEAFDVCSWDPYDEGYDDGPADLEDSWRLGGPTGCGMFRGWVVGPDARVFDPVSASVVVALADSDWDYDDAGQEADPDSDTVAKDGDHTDFRDDIRSEFATLLQKNWTPPRSREDRDKALAEEILRLASMMSPAAVKDVVEQLRSW